MIEAIHNSINDRTTSGALSPTLYVKLDNCTCENHTRTFTTHSIKPSNDYEVRMQSL